ncbi:MAG TPA: histidine kinase [Candidatus Limnocylindria bacterium]|nr:histidine kinase [Candidatus Limnocylindria bacterium]
MTERLRRIQPDLSPRGLLIDVAIAVGLTILALFALFAGAPDLGPEGVANVALLLLQSAPLAVRRLFPIPVFVIVFGALVLQMIILPAGAELRSGAGPLLALYTLGERLERRVALPLVAAALVVIGVLFVGRTELPEGLQALIQTELFFGAAWFIGDSVRIRRLYTRSVEQTAELLEREREERARRAVREERERIAREMHDAVTHHVSVIVIQAGGALRALDRRPQDAREALDAIDHTGRQALTDMRRMLGILGETESQEPMPGLDRLGDLLEQVRSAGLAVELAIEGDRRPLDPGLELSAYRIIQEGLTNALKHTGGGRARVTVMYESGSLGITVDDERGRGAQEPLEPAHHGRGLVGMRERVAMFGGSFEAAPTTRGFRVHARLPLGDAGGAG